MKNIGIYGIIFAMIIIIIVVAIKNRNITYGSYFDVIYKKGVYSNILPIPTNSNDFLLVYNIPHTNTNIQLLWNKFNNLPKFTGDNPHPLYWWGLIFNALNPNRSIKLGQTIGWKQIWSNWTKWPMIWKNPFDPNIVGNGGKGILPGTKYIEVTSALPQEGPGCWLNIMPGSGMFFELKNTLISRNKVDALIKLGMSTSDIVQKWGDNFSWNGWTTPSVQTITYGGYMPMDSLPPNSSPILVKDYIFYMWGIDNLKDLLDRVQNNTDNIIAFEWISNCPIVDNETFNRAKSQGYDTVQYYCTGYNGYWANEIMCVSYAPNNFGQLAYDRIKTTTGKCPLDQLSNSLICSF